MKKIERVESLGRASRIVIHGDTVHVGGVTGRGKDGITAQMTEVLSKIDGYLAQAGTDKSRLLTAQIWLKDIDRDFEAMNAVWRDWVLPESLPTRATCQARLAAPELLVEVIVSAARGE